MSAWWCYISFSDLFKSVYGREPTLGEKEDFKKYSKEQLNQWVIDHMAKARGKYVAVMMNGYLAFTILPYYMKGIWDKALKFVEGSTRFDYKTTSGGKYWYEVVNQNGVHTVTTHWDNGGNDQGTGTITLTADGYLTRFVLKNSSGSVNSAHDFNQGKFVPAGLGAENTRQFVTTGLED